MSLLIASGKATASKAVKSSYVWTDSVSSKDLLLKHKRGAYTTGRTVGFGTVLEWDMQLERLDKSIGKLCHQQIWTKPMITSFLKDSLIQFYDKFPLKNYDIRITLLFSDESNDDDDGDSSCLGYCHLGVLPDPPKTCNVEIVSCKARSEANVKDSEWIRERQGLESSMGSGITEIILQDIDGNLYEGLSSNFFVLEKDKFDNSTKIVTAPKETILPGTIMRVIEEISRDLKSDTRFPRNIEYRLPNVADVNMWEGAFISSTSRLLLPIKELYYRERGTGNRVCRVFNDPDSLTNYMQSIVKSQLPQYASRIL